MTWSDAVLMLLTFIGAMVVGTALGYGMAWFILTMGRAIF